MDFRVESFCVALYSREIIGAIDCGNPRLARDFPFAIVLAHVDAILTKSDCQTSFSPPAPMLLAALMIERDDAQPQNG